MELEDIKAQEENPLYTLMKNTKIFIPGNDVGLDQRMTVQQLYKHMADEKERFELTQAVGHKAKKR